ncbi:MAG: hypothetical protein NWR72_00690, partial [Bacteroidia bacterium]|nr:hypothetical protein [Bacteroidia bacterium]
KAYTKYKTITRTPVYELGWNRDTVDFWTYQGLSAEQKVFSWAKTATIKADIALEAPAPWLTTPDSVSLDIAGKRVPLSVNSTGLPSGVHYAKVILQGSSSDVVNPSLTVTYQPDTLVVRLTVGPSPDGIVLLNQPDICDGIELGSSFTFPVDLLTPGATAVNLASSSHSNTGNFALSSTLPAVLAPNAETSLSMTFTPDSVGPFTSIFTVSHNGTNNSSQVMLTCEAIPACVVPTNWIETSLGTPSLTGSACVTGNTYRMTAAGKNIWSKDDEGHFLATPVSGDGEMIMKLNWLTQQDNDTKIGIMFRETLAKDSRNAFLAINPENAIALQYRKNPGESTSKVENKGFYPPQWMKLVRVGNTFTAYHSEDGVTWMVINGGNNPQTFAMSDTIYAGIAFTSHNASALSTAEVQFVSLNFAPVTFPVTLSSFDATLLGESVKIKWEAASEENFSHYEVQRKTGINPEFQAISQVAGRGMPFYTSWDHRPVSGQNVYRLVMHDIDGSIAYSDQVSVMVDVTRAFTVRHLDGDQALELMWESESTPAKISLLDITGRELYSVDKDMQIGSRNLLQLPGLSSGYYLLEVKWNGKSDRRVLSLQ